MNRRVILKEFFEKEGISYTEHNAHGLYFDAWIEIPAVAEEDDESLVAILKRLELFGGDRSILRFMVDCSPEDLQPGESRDLIVVRDYTHHYSKPTRVGVIDLHNPGSLDQLKTLIDVGHVCKEYGEKQ